MIRLLRTILFAVPAATLAAQVDDAALHERAQGALRKAVEF
jgi:hypothetical protein